MIDPAHLTDAELAAWYGSGLHREKAGRLIEEVRRLRARLVGEIELRCTFQAESERGEEMVDRLRARLAEVEAERDEAKAFAIAEHGAFQTMNDRRAIAESRLAEVEAERNTWKARAESARVDLDVLLGTRPRYCCESQSRLAAVLALCDEIEARHPLTGLDRTIPYAIRHVTEQVRGAAAAGDDRG